MCPCASVPMCPCAGVPVCRYARGHGVYPSRVGVCPRLLLLFGGGVCPRLLLPMLRARAGRAAEEARQVEEFVDAYIKDKAPR